MRYFRLTIWVMALALLAELAIAQEWEWLSPSPTSLGLNDVTFVSDDRGWVAGYSGVVAATADRGDTWSTVQIDSVDELTSLSFVNENEGWAAGYRGNHPAYQGVIAHTTDGGVSWIMQVQLDSCVVHDVMFTSPLTGWAVGYSWSEQSLRLRTVNGGLTWEAATDTMAHHGYAVYFLNDLCGWTVGSNGSLLQTSDGGINWQRYDLDYGYWLKDIMFVDEQHGYITADGGLVYITHDGGDSWYPRYSGAENHVLFLDSLNGFGLSWGEITYTTDGGENWHLRELPDGLRAEALTSSPGHHLWVAGREGVIHESADFGETWALKTHYLVPSCRDVEFLTPDAGWVVGDSGAYRTSDGGATWEQYPLPGDTVAMYDVEFVDAQRGFILTASNHVWRTTDGGETWLSGAPIGPAPHYGITHIDFVDSTWGVAGGEYLDNGWEDYARLYRTTDAGQSWTLILNQHWGWTVSAVSFAVRDHGYVMRASMDFLYTHDGGNTWHTPSLWDFSPADVEAITDSICYVPRYSYQGPIGLWRTQDGGASWEELATPYYVSQFEFLDSLHGLAISADYSMYTSDAGATWSTVLLPTHPGINSVSVVDTAHAWACGDGGTLLRYTGAITPAYAPNIVLPTTLALANYPNPFNPTTTLAFELPVSGFVKLNVYDITGRLTATLLNESHQAGRFTVSFDGSRLASGVYIARLETAASQTTHKLLLLK